MADTKLGSAFVDIRANLAPLNTGLAKVHSSFSTALASALSLERVLNRMAFIGTVGAFFTAWRLLSQSIGDGTKEAISFEKAIAHVNTVLDEGAKKYIPEFTKEIENLSIQLGVGVDNLAASLYDIISARIPPEHALYVLAQATELAVANQAELRDVTKAVLTILNAYNMSVEDAGIVTDKLQVAIKFGRMEMSELAPVLGDLASAAAVLDIKLEDVLGTLATMTRAGFNPKKTVTSMRRAFMAMAEDAEIAAMIAKDGFLSVIPIIAAMDQEQQKVITGGIRGWQTYAVAMQNWLAAGKDVEEMLKAEGEVAKALGIEMDSTGKKIDQAGKRAKDSWREVGDELKTSIPFWKDVGASFGDITSETIKTVKWIGKLGGLLGKISNDSMPTLMKSVDGVFRKTQDATDAVVEYEGAWRSGAFLQTVGNNIDAINDSLGKQQTKLMDAIKLQEAYVELAESLGGRGVSQEIEKQIEIQERLVAVLEQKVLLGYKKFELELVEAKIKLNELRTSLKETKEAHKALAVEIEENPIRLSIIAPQDIDMEAFDARLNTMKEKWQEVTDFMEDGISHTLNIITDRTMDGADKWEAIWTSFVDSAIQEINRLIAKMIIAWAFKTILSGGTGIGTVNPAVPASPVGSFGGNFSPVINNSVSASFSRRDMGFIVNAGNEFNKNTRL